MRANDLARAREINNRIRATSTVFYAEPRTDMHNRMKEALVLLGELHCAAVRPPQVKLPGEEIARTRQGLIAAGLLAQNGRALKAAQPALAITLNTSVIKDSGAKTD